MESIGVQQKLMKILYMLEVEGFGVSVQIHAHLSMQQQLLLQQKMLEILEVG